MTTAGLTWQWGEYPDNGCKLHEHCLTCPLPRCVYDRQTDTHHSVLLNEVQRHRKEGLTSQEIADRLNVSRRTITRAIKEMRNG